MKIAVWPFEMEFFEVRRKLQQGLDTGTIVTMGTTGIEMEGAEMRKGNPRRRHWCVM